MDLQISQGRQAGLRRPRRHPSSVDSHRPPHPPSDKAARLASTGSVGARSSLGGGAASADIQPSAGSFETGTQRFTGPAGAIPCSHRAATRNESRGSRGDTSTGAGLVTARLADPDAEAGVSTALSVLQRSAG